jgi:hypothetical protein
MARPDSVRLDRHDGATAFVKDKVAHIPADLDRRFRRGLQEAVARDGGKTAHLLVIDALTAGPSRGGALEAMRYFGPLLQVELVHTAQIIDGLEVSMNGFKRWLELTGFANDVTMIKAFIEWSHYKNAVGRVIGGVQQAFDA